MPRKSTAGGREVVWKAVCCQGITLGPVIECSASGIRRSGRILVLGSFLEFLFNKK